MTVSNAAMPLRVDIVSDVVCPWCIIGYKQLLKALAELPGQFELELHWHPFELNPQMPAEGQELREHIAIKYGSTPEQSAGARSRLTELGDSLGFSFDYYDGMRMVNTFMAHQLLHWAAELGKQTPLKLVLFSAFFSQQRDVNDTEVLVNAAVEVGLDSDEARAVLTDGRYAEAVRADQQYWRDQDVAAVPTFYFQQQYVVPGAQEAETFVRVLQKIQSRGAQAAS